MALYEDLRQVDVLMGPIHNLLANKVLIVKDGKIVYDVLSEIRAHEPWLYTRLDHERACALWTFYFEQYGLLPRGCMNCWKVTARPRTLKELLKIREVQKKMDLPAKCGVEDRPFAQFRGPYVAFWYGPYGEGMEGALELYKKVRFKVSDAVGIQVPVVLKRGCTEMEDRVGPSNGWRYPPEMHALENMLDKIVSIWSGPLEQPWFSKVHILINWIEYARKIRDATVNEFVTDIYGSFGATRTTTYHDVIPPIDQKEVIPDETQQSPQFPRLQMYL